MIRVRDILSSNRPKEVRVPRAVQKLDQLQSEWRTAGIVRPKCKKWLDLHETWYLMVSELANYDFQLKIYKIKTLDSIWRTKKKKRLDSDETWYSGFFEVADYESKLEMKDFEMLDLIWPITMQKVTWV